MLFNGWTELRHILIVGAASYLVLILMLRISGKRTLSKLNAFDLIITIALGSTLASAFTQGNLSIAGASLTFALLVGLQFVITWLAFRSEKVNQLIKSEPVLLFYDGSFLDPALRKERVTREEVMSALRSCGITRMEDVKAVVLESNAEVTCLRKEASPGAEGSTLPDSNHIIRQ